MYAAETPESKVVNMPRPVRSKVIPKICKEATARESDMPKNAAALYRREQTKRGSVYARQLAMCEVGGRWVDGLTSKRDKVTSVICAKQVGRGNLMPKWPASRKRERREIEPV